MGIYQFEIGGGHGNQQHYHKKRAISQKKHCERENCIGVLLVGVFLLGYDQASSGKDDDIKK